MNDTPMDDPQEGESLENEDEKPFLSIGELYLSLFREAISARATEIHIRPIHEPFAKPAVRLRFRVEGDLVPGDTDIPWNRYDHLVSRLKKMGRMDVAERRVPQNGAMVVNVDGKL